MIKTVMPQIIYQGQGAFVRGRKLLYNVLICYNIAMGYQRKHISPRCILKMDLQKAFDSIHWNFVREMLESLKLLAVFTKWVLICVTSVDFRIHINGEDQGGFKVGRGLRQGDPLSPLLFVICMEYLSRMMQLMGQARSFKFHPQC